MPQEISVRIDGELCRASEGQTILEVARVNKKYIPTLCFLEGLTPSGSCRLCLVEVAGVGRLLPACTTPIQNGMSVTTDSKKLRSSIARWPWNSCCWNATITAPYAFPTIIVNCKRWLSA